MTAKQLYAQNSAAPTEKVKAVIYTGKLVSLVFGLVAIFYPEAFERIPAGFEMVVGSLLTSVVTDLAGYFKREKVA